MGLLDRIRAAQANSEGTDAAVTRTAEASIETVPTRPRQEWGKPGRCPECSGRGYLDHIDLVDRVMYQHCTECRHAWVVAESELVSQD